ncbi:MAG: hypothetical protein RI973_1082 [Bacteroidota bacterium]|jgi:hypothetical protein
MAWTGPYRMTKEGACRRRARMAAVKKGPVRTGLSIGVAIMAWTGPYRMTKGGACRRWARMAAVKGLCQDRAQHWGGTYGVDRSLQDDKGGSLPA